MSLQQPTRPEGAELAGPFPPDLHDVRHLWLKAGLLLVWALASFGATYFARNLQALVWGGWPLGNWMAAQGAVLVFIAIVVIYGWAMNRFEQQDALQNKLGLEGLEGLEGAEPALSPHAPRYDGRA